MKQPNFAGKIIIMSIEGIHMGIYSVIRIFISLLLRLILGPSAFANSGQSNSITLPLSETIKIEVGKSPGSVETVHLNKDKFVDLGKRYTAQQIKKDMIKKHPQKKKKAPIKSAL